MMIIALVSEIHECVCGNKEPRTYANRNLSCLWAITCDHRAEMSHLRLVPRSPPPPQTPRPPCQRSSWLQRTGSQLSETFLSKCAFPVPGQRCLSTQHGTWWWERRGSLCVCFEWIIMPFQTAPNREEVRWWASRHLWPWFQELRS